MLSRLFHPGSLLAPLLLCLTLVPVSAQDMRAKDAWDALRAFAQGAGLAVTSAGIDQDGAALVARDVRIHSAENPAMAAAHLPLLRLEPRGADGVALLLPAGGTLHSAEGNSESRQLAIETDGAVLMALDENALRLAPQLDLLRLTLLEAARNGRPLNERFDLRIAELSGHLHVTGEPQINAEGQIRAARLAYEFFQHDTLFIESLRDEEMEVIGPALAFTLTELQLLDGEPAFLARAFAGGFSARLAFEAEASSSRSVQRMDGLAISVVGASGHSDGLLTLEDGMLTLRGESHDSRFSGEAAGITGEAGIARAASSLQLPLTATADERPFGLTFELSGVEASPETWAMLGAAGMAGDIADLMFGITGHGRWLYEITEEPPAGDAPIDFSRIALDGLTLRFGSATLDGRGEFALEPGSLSSPEPFEQGSGDFTFELTGGDALLTRLSSEGLIPADQQFLARMMLSALARPVGEDQLRSEIAIRPGGQILVNGLPLPF
ncbi:MAG: hypothetical protein ACK4LQ_06300 [Pararhodobacter sp.]